ncbi:MAG: selenocysteine-specific translation elongation factor [Thermodesulfobacteriaceae bacterium]|jgi:selenocysteine-specific elongation factor
MKSLPLKSVIVGTAGHVDHGKSTLVKVLTGIDPDRLKEEKERGITIDLGFAHLILPSGILAGIVDVPGHERFIHNMVIGAGGVDLVMLVIAADEGVMPQTVEHLEICELLGIKDGFVVLTKVDLVDEELLELITEDIREFLKGTFLEGAPIIPFSAVTLQGKEDIIKVLDEKAKKVQEKPIHKPFRLPIDGVFTVKGHGTVVRGTAISGEVAVGDEVMVYPQGILTKVRSIQVHGKPVDKAYAGMRTALNLLNVSKDEVERGNVVSLPGVLKPTQWLDVEIKTVRKLSKPLKNFENLLLYIGTSEVLAKLILVVKNELSANERDVAQLYVSKPIVCFRDDRFILRRPGTNETVAGGRVLLAVTTKRKRTKPWEKEELLFLAQGDASEIAYYLIKNKGRRGLKVEDLSYSLSVYGQEIEDIIKSLNEKLIIIPEGQTSYLFANSALAELKEEILERLEKYHQANPLSPGLSKEALKSRLSDEPNYLLYERALSQLLHEQKIHKDKDLYLLPQYRSIKSTELEEVKKKVEQTFLKEGLTPRDAEEILLDFGDKYYVAKELFKILQRENVLIPLTEKLVYHRDILEEVKRKVFAYFERHKELTVSAFRDLLGGNLSRKYLIPLLEYLDKEKITLRVGDKRVLRKTLTQVSTTKT